MQGDHQSLVVKDPDPKWSDTRKSAYCFNDLWLKFMSKERRQRYECRDTACLLAIILFHLFSLFLPASQCQACPSLGIRTPLWPLTHLPWGAYIGTAHKQHGQAAGRAGGCCRRGLAVSLQPQVIPTFRDVCGYFPTHG